MSDSWQRVCALDELTDSSGREFAIGDQVIAVFRVDGKVCATDGMCAHQGGPLAAGDVDGSCVTCPWHGWQYDITNGCNLLTGRKMISTFPVEIRDDQAVWVNLLGEA